MADERLTDKTTLSTVVAGDLMHVVDVSDQSANANGTSKKATIETITQFGDNRTAEFKNKTIRSADNDLTVNASDIPDLDTAISSNSAVVANTAKNSYPAADALKLAGIQTGAEVNVNADWNASSGDAQILNKPTIPSALADLSADSTHRTVTDTEKSTWNGKIANVVEDTTPQLGGDLDLNQKSISLNSSPSVDDTANGLIASMTVGENVVYGNMLYLKSDGKLWKAKADAEATTPVIAMAMATISADAAGNVLLHGIVRDDTLTNTVGGKIYLSKDTAGAITQTAPTTTNHVVQILGIATHADRLYFNPQLAVVVRA